MKKLILSQQTLYCIKYSSDDFTDTSLHSYIMDEVIYTFFEHMCELTSYSNLDVNECAKTPSPCHANAHCNNTMGGHTCTCKSGYSGNGTHCTDVNECAKTVAPCGTGFNCTNLIGSFKCQRCPTGYNGNGKTCSDINECTTSKPCHSNATCTNNVGSYSCKCISGYNGDGKNCTDINECLAKPCSSLAGCTNLPGTFKCGVCPSGYSGNGTTCTGMYTCNNDLSLHYYHECDRWLAVK